MTARAPAVVSATSVLLLLGLGAPAPSAVQAMPFHTNTALPLPLAEAGIRTFLQYTESGLASREGEFAGGPGNPTFRISALPLMVPYAVRPGTFVMVGIPYLDKRFEQGGATQSNRGLGDVTLLVKQELMAADVVMGNRRLALFLSATLPSGETRDEGEALPVPLRLGSGTTVLKGEAVYSYVQDRVGIHGAVGYALPTGSHDGVRRGDAFSFDLGLGYRLRPGSLETLRERTLQAYLELNGTVTQPAVRDDVPLESTGGTLIYLSPGLQWIPRPNLAVEGSVQVPVSRRVRGTQLAPEWSGALGLRVLFGPFGR